MSLLNNGGFLKLGYDICGSAATGEEAMQYVADMRPDLVLMDINLEGEIDGIETAARIKKDYNIPIIFVSAYFDEATIARAKAINPEGFLRKPFDDDDLRIAIELGLKK
ncbi:MAG TPA: response regulator [Methanoregula sp.]|nr:response regulator [Methanoregula sp.]